MRPPTLILGSPVEDGCCRLTGEHRAAVGARALVRSRGAGRLVHHGHQGHAHVHAQSVHYQEPKRAHNGQDVARGDAGEVVATAVVTDFCVGLFQQPALKAALAHQAPSLLMGRAESVYDLLLPKLHSNHVLTDYSPISLRGFQSAFDLELRIKN